MSHNALGRLHDLAVFVSAEGELPARLQDLALLAASVTEAASCSIMLLSEGGSDAPRLKLWCSTEELSSSAWRETPGPGESIAGRVLERSASLLIADIGASEFASLARHRDTLGDSFICTPVVVGNHVIGVMNLSSRVAAPAFDESHLRLAEIVAALIAKSIQVERLQTLIRSRVAHLSLAREEKEVVTRLTDGTAPPAQIAKLLAKSFFRDLSAAGFDAGQIIDAASEIITLVSNDIRRYKRHAQRKAR